MYVAFAQLPCVARGAQQGLNTVARRWLAAIACIAALLSTGPVGAAPTYMSYFGLGRNIPEAQDHVNLYWAVSWDWNINEVLSQLADAKGRGMRAIVHTEFAFFTGSGAYANGCPSCPSPVRTNSPPHAGPISAEAVYKQSRSASGVGIETGLEGRGTRLGHCAPGWRYAGRQARRPRK